MGAVAGGLFSAAGGILGSSGAGKAAKAQVEAARIAAQSQERMFNKSLQVSEPWREGGRYALKRMESLLALGPDTGQPGYGKWAQAALTPNKFKEGPDYAFRLSEGMKALERSAAAQGKLMSGPMMKGIVRFGQGLASEEWNNAFNRYQIERNAALNPLQSLAGLGQSSASQASANAMNYGTNLANTQMAQGQARASGYVGKANALSGALSNVGNMFASMGGGGSGSGLDTYFGGNMAGWQDDTSSDYGLW